MGYNKDKALVRFRNYFMIFITLVIVGSAVAIVVSNKGGKNPPVLPNHSGIIEDTSLPEVLPPIEENEDDEEKNNVEPQEETSEPKKPEWTDEDRASPYFEEDMPILVNSTNKIPEDYKPDLKEWTPGFELDKKAFDAYYDMYTASQKDGVSIWMVSAYRSKEKQEKNFNSKVEEYKRNGMSEDDAVTATAKIIAHPDSSEHSLGLAVDLNSLYESFDQTKAFRWLQENCAKYGFILRYPKGKEDITGYKYEPWHYRYVGSNHAKFIMEHNICLEEYLMGEY